MLDKETNNQVKIGVITGLILSILGFFGGLVVDALNPFTAWVTNFFVAFVTWLGEESSIYNWFSTLLFIIFISAFLHTLKYRKLVKSMADQKESVPKIAKQSDSQELTENAPKEVTPNNMTPNITKYQDFCSMSFMGLMWRWRWRPNYDTPVQLKALCPVCCSELTAVRTLSGLMESTLYKCPKFGCKNQNGIEYFESQEAIKKKAAVEIERLAFTGEFRELLGSKP